MSTFCCFLYCTCAAVRLYANLTGLSDANINVLTMVLLLICVHLDGDDMIWWMVFCNVISLFLSSICQFRQRKMLNGRPLIDVR